jgi:peptidoglycan/LPS O-acetylase OafA/YrhL
MMGTKRNHWLTVVRFFAALWVVIHHMSFLREATPSSNLVHQLSISGFAGVTLFFVLSGVVLAMSYDGKVGSPSGILKFYWARLTRIVPLWFLVSFPILFRKDFQGEGFLEYVTFLQAWSPNILIAYGYLAVAWTLSVEMFFYLVFPLVAFVASILHRTKLAGPILIVAGLAIPITAAVYYDNSALGDIGGMSDALSSHRVLYRLPLLRLGDFIAGIGLYYLWKEAPQLRRAWPFYIALGIVGIAFVVAITDEGTWAWDAAWIGPFALLLFGLLCAPQSLTDRAPKLAILLGEASFALYLIHQAYIIPQYQGLYGTAAGHPIAAALTVASISICLSIGLFMAFERPVMNFLRNPFRAIAAPRDVQPRPAE